MRQKEVFSVLEKRLYVGNLSYDTTEAELREHFAQAGTVESATVVIDHGTGRSRGFGFVEMSSPEEADRAIQLLHAQPLRNRNLRVNRAHPMNERRVARLDDGRRGNAFP
ncbi:RNA-binding protein [bacterium]|nr:RNA-binding protein [bacterium]